MKSPYYKKTASIAVCGICTTISTIGARVFDSVSCVTGDKQHLPFGITNSITAVVLTLTAMAVTVTTLVQCTCSMLIPVPGFLANSDSGAYSPIIVGTCFSIGVLHVDTLGSRID